MLNAVVHVFIPTYAYILLVNCKLKMQGCILTRMCTSYSIEFSNSWTKESQEHVPPPIEEPAYHVHSYAPFLDNGRARGMSAILISSQIFCGDPAGNSAAVMPPVRRLLRKRRYRRGFYCYGERKKRYRRIFPWNLKSVALFLDVSMVCHDPKRESKRQ